jgi:hypothetical protein
VVKVLKMLKKRRLGAWGFDVTDLQRWLVVELEILESKPVAEEV